MLHSGDDLTRLDAFGKWLLTNDEVIAVDQAGTPARPVSTATNQQVWWAHNRDGSYTVALFNLDGASAAMTADFSDFAVSGRATVRDLWHHRTLPGRRSSVTVSLPAHGSALYRLTPKT